MKNFGPLSTPHGRVDAEVHATTLKLRQRSSSFDLGDFTELFIVLGAVALAVLGAFLPEPLNYVCFGLAAAVVIGIVVLHLVAYAMAAGMLVMAAVRMLTKDGRRRLRESARSVKRSFDVGPRELPRSDILSVSPVERRLRPRIRLGLAHGELVLSAWAWRRGQLEGLAQELGVSVSP